MPRRRVLAIVACGAAAIYAAVSVYVLSASLTPSKGVCPPSEGPPSDVALEAIVFRSRVDGVRLAGWLGSSLRDRAVILIHGIDSDAWAGAAPDLVRAYLDAEFNVLLFDLRAHGRSEGNRIGLGALERHDVHAAVDLLLERGIPPGRIGLHGTSYGAAMALLAAAEIPEVGAVIADSAYADIRDLIATEVGRRTRLPGWMAAWLMRPGIENAARLLFAMDLAALAPEAVVARIAPRPLLLIHGSQDPVIPPDHARRLKDHAVNAAAELWMLEGLRHTEGARMGPCNLVPLPGRREFLGRIVGFMDAALGSVEGRH
jgi:pimeloyl-ACP methyl ester carboxylesterase